MSVLSDILAFNSGFVEREDYRQFSTSRYPDKRLVVVTCMDTRLIELLPRAMNFRNGDIKVIKNAGALITHPFGSVMRSVLVAVYQLKASEVAVIGHHDCGMTGFNGAGMIESAKQRGIKEDVFFRLREEGVDLNKWLTGFESVADSVRESVGIIVSHPLLPPDVPVHGMIIHPETGRLELVIDGYDKSKIGQ